MRYATVVLVACAVLAVALDRGAHGATRRVVTSVTGPAEALVVVSPHPDDDTRFAEKVEEPFWVE